MKLKEIKQIIREELRAVLREDADEYIGHTKIKDGILYVDSNLVNKTNTLNLGLDHLGMGDFGTKKPLELPGCGGVTLQFLRKSETIPGFVGRAHKVIIENEDGERINTDMKAVAQLVKIFKQKGLVK